MKSIFYKALIIMGIMVPIRVTATPFYVSNKDPRLIGLVATGVASTLVGLKFFYDASTDKNMVNKSVNFPTTNVSSSWRPFMPFAKGAAFTSFGLGMIGLSKHILQTIDTKLFKNSAARVLRKFPRWLKK